MKDKRSKFLRAVVTEANRPHRTTAADRKLFAWLGDPSNWREPVYAWLWVNHDDVLNMRTRWDGLSWEAIAMIMREDGVKGSRGVPPHANSVRRVWGRVHRDKIAREKWDVEHGRIDTDRPP